MKNTRLIFLSVLFALALGLLVIQLTAMASSASQFSNSGAYINHAKPFRYHGVLGSAESINADCDMVFRLFDRQVKGKQMGETISQLVSIHNGEFSVNLDFNDTLVSVENPWLDIAVQCPGDPEFVHLERQQISAANVAAIQSSLDGFPVGTVIDWWRPALTSTLPAGYMICDGSVVDDADSPLDGETLPNFTDRFVRGVTDSGTVGFTTGGNDNHTHSVDLPGHTHGVSHNHAGDTCTIDDNTEKHDVKIGGLLSDNWIVSPDHDHSCWGYQHETSTYNGTSVPKNYGAKSSDAGTFLPAYVGLLKLCKIK